MGILLQIILPSDTDLLERGDSEVMLTFERLRFKVLDVIRVAGDLGLGEVKTKTDEDKLLLFRDVLIAEISHKYVRQSCIMHENSTI